jgi:hypothetical protein
MVTTELATGARRGCVVDSVESALGVHCYIGYQGEVASENR